MIMLIIPVLTALAILMDVFFGGNVPQFETAKHFLYQPLAILPFVLFILIFGPIPEELGWRGYVLDRLQVKLSAIVSSLVLGAFWALWHLPLFFMEGFLVLL